jgi:hypothetical protein
VTQQESRLLSAETSHDGNALVLTCTGSAETEAFEALSDALSNVHDDAVKRSAPQVIADVRELEFASSSCLKAFVTWLQRVQELDDDHRYKVKFRSNPRHSWQKRSLGALAAFAAGVVEIETEGPQ